MIPDEDCYLMWQYCHDLNDIDKAIKEHDEDWEGLESLHQIISITYDTNHGCYVVFWIAYKGGTGMSDPIDRQAAIRWVKTECNPYGNPTLDFESGKKVIEHLEQMPSAQPECWMEKNKERILQAGMEGREVEFRIGGRLFAIREKAQ